MVTLDSSTIEATSQFETLVHQRLDNIDSHDLWLAASVLNPAMRDISFLVYSKNRRSALSDAKAITRKIKCPVYEHEKSNDAVTGSSHIGNNFGAKVLGKDLICQEEFMYFIRTTNFDELVCYLVDDLPTAIASYLERNLMGVVRYWIEH